MAKLAIGSALAQVCAQLAESVAGQISWQTVCGGVAHRNKDSKADRKQL